MDAKPVDREGQLYTVSCAISYKQLEHSQILVSVGLLGPTAHGYLRTTNTDLFNLRNTQHP